MKDVSLSYKWVTVLLFIFLFGCNSVGPRILTLDRYQYNIAFDDSRNKELLLNMVRVRYNYPPMVLSVGNISGSTKLQSTGDLSGVFNWGSVFGQQLLAGNGYSYSDNPIISYTPLEDSDYSKRFLSRFHLDQIMALIETSWSIPRVFRMLLQQAGTSMNASNAARPTSHHVPKYQEFMNMVYVLRRLQLKDALDLSYTESDDGKTENLVFHLNKNGHLTAKETLILKKAGVEVYHNDIVFSNHAGPHKTLVVTRSVLGVLNYLSKGVAIPPEDVKNNMLTMTVYRNGQMFDWQRVLEGIMKIEYSSKKPKNASVEIYYLNRWYYISNTDNNSKKSFMLLTNLLGLIALTPQPSPIGLTRNV